MLGRTYDTQDCSAARTLELVGERWSLLILRDAIFGGYTRFSQFEKSLGVATTILTKRLEDLVAYGILERRTGDAGEQAEYTPTRKGLELKPIIIALTEWGDKWVRPGPLVFRSASDGQPVKLRLARANGGAVALADVVARPR